MHCRRIEPSIIVTVAQSVTSRPPMLADIRLRSEAIYRGNLYTQKMASEIYTRHFRRLKKCQKPCSKC